MIVAATLTVGWTLTLLAAFQLLRAERRQHARERDLLLNQLLHTVGKPWLEAPADHRPAAAKEPRRWTATPEQQPYHD